MEGNICFIPVSIGELFDKYTILQIKQNQVKDAKKLEIVGKELSYLKQFINTYNLEESLVNELKETNEKLWVIEDKIREKEKEHKFDEEFVKLARNVYITNDKRSEIKNKINLKLKSGIQEVKSYSKYTDNDVETINININTKVEEQKPILNTKIKVEEQKPILNTNTKVEETKPIKFEEQKPILNTKIKVEETKPIVNKSKNIDKTKSKSEQIEELNKEINKLKNTLNYDELIDNYKKIIELDSQNENKYLHNMGEVFEKQTKYESAVDCYEKILKKENNDYSTIGVINNQIGMCYFNLKKSKLAVGYFKNVLLIKEIPDVFCNISTCYVDLKKFKLAENALLKSYNLDNTHKNTIYLLANLYYYLKNYSKSLDFYKKALSNKVHIDSSDNLLYSFALSLTYLAKKDFSNGFTLYEKRLLTNDINKQTGKLDRLEIPQIELWDGKEICDYLLVVYEQGIGDNIQFYRFLIILAEKYPKMEIHYFTRDNLTHLFTTPHKNITIIENMVSLNYDYKVYIMTIPKILNLTNIEPNKINYIEMNEEKLLYWKEKTEPLKKFRVGFVYNGLLSSFIEKYIPLEEFGILCDLNIDLICIHRKSEVENDFKNISFGDKITQYDIDVDKPFEDTVHLLKNIDLLITVDTYIVHLAGVLNVKTWLLLGTHDWRWSNDENKTYWYDSVELIRTKQYEEFKDNIKTVKTKLSELLEILGSQSHINDNLLNTTDIINNKNKTINMSLESYLNNKGFYYVLEGHIQLCPQKVNDLISLTNKPNINIMEIGFNAGHSSEIFLKNNNNLTITSFDLGRNNYTSTSKEYIDNIYPNRHTLIIGDSNKTVPNYIKNNKDVKFDFIFIDGGHDYETVKIDIENCFHLSHKDTIVAIDDTMFTKIWEKHYTIGPTKVWLEQLQQYKIFELNRKDYSVGFGMSWGKYIM